MKKRISKELAEEYKPLIWYELHNNKRKPSAIASALGISTQVLNTLVDGYKPNASTPLRITLAEVAHLRKVAQELHTQIRAEVAEEKRQWLQRNTSEVLLGTMPITLKEQRAFQRLKDEILGKPKKTTPPQKEEIPAEPFAPLVEEQGRAKYPCMISRAGASWSTKTARRVYVDTPND